MRFTSRICSIALLWLEIDDAAFHHEAHLPNDTNILRRIAFEGDEIG